MTPPLGSDEPQRYEIFHDIMVPALIDWRRRYVAERQGTASEEVAERRRTASEQVEQELPKIRQRLRLYSLLFAAALALLLVLDTAILVLVVKRL
jgi:hypothetical protein